MPVRGAGSTQVPSAAKARPAHRLFARARAWFRPWERASSKATAPSARHRRPIAADGTALSAAAGAAVLSGNRCRGQCRRLGAAAPAPARRRSSAAAPSAAPCRRISSVLRSPGEAVDEAALVDRRDLHGDVVAERLRLLLEQQRKDDGGGERQHDRADQAAPGPAFQLVDGEVGVVGDALSHAWCRRSPSSATSAAATVRNDPKTTILSASSASSRAARYADATSSNVRIVGRRDSRAQKRVADVGGARAARTGQRRDVPAGRCVATWQRRHRRCPCRRACRRRRSCAGGIPSCRARQRARARHADCARRRGRP